METKEDIIQIFMQEFDNSKYKDEILKVISREDIYIILKEEIREVKYTDKKQGFAAEYDSASRILYINKVRDNIKTENRDKLNKIIFVHEMWHAISNRISNFITKSISDKETIVILSDKNMQDINNGNMISGYSGLEKYETTDRGIEKTGLAFTEGMTQLMAERMLGYSLIGSYQTEKEIIAILENFVGRGNIISDYIYGTSKAEKEIDKKYGKRFSYNYRHLRKALDANLEITNKLIGEMSIDDEENRTLLLDNQKQKKEFIKSVLGNLIQIEKSRVEEINKLESYEDYNKLLKRLSYSQSEEIRTLEIFDLEKEIQINEEKIESLKGRNDNDDQKEAHNMTIKIENATSEITISGLNSQIINVNKNVRFQNSEKGEIINDNDRN